MLYRILSAGSTDGNIFAICKAEPLEISVAKYAHGDLYSLVKFFRFYAIPSELLCSAEESENIFLQHLSVVVLVLRPHLNPLWWCIESLLDGLLKFPRLRWVQNDAVCVCFDFEFVAG